MTVVWLSGCAKPEAPAVVGTLEWDRVELFAELSEPITATPVEEGAEVARGDLIVKLDDRRARAWHEQAVAARARAAARLAELKRGPRKEEIEQASARLRGAESRLENAIAELRRVERLHAEQVVSAEDLDRARTARDEAQANHDAAHAALAALLAGSTVEELQQAEAAEAEAAARVRETALTLERMEIRAPVDGILDERLYDSGERPQPGIPVAILLRRARPYARVYVPESLRMQVVVGTRARIVVDGVAEPFTGHVTRISRDPVFTPFRALTERERGRLSWVAEIDVDPPVNVAAGMPVTVLLEPDDGGDG